MTAPAPAPSASDPLRGERFGKYVLLKRLAVGGMAEVHLARLEGEAGFQKLMVIKQVLPQLADDANFVEMFLDEARLAARLSHPNIAHTFDLGQADGRYYLAMEYVPGETMSAVLQRAQETHRPFPLACGLRAVIQLLEALDYAHTLADDDGRPLGIVHRDVSPSNLMLTYHGGVKLLDFGIARAATRHHRTQAGVIKGKFGYIAPEYARTMTLDARADLYAAGAILYLLATGRPVLEEPPTADPAKKVAALLEAKVVPPREVNPALSEELEGLILRALAREPRERFPAASEMLAAIERFATAAGWYAGARELATCVRELFPERSGLVRATELNSDARVVAELLQTLGDAAPPRPPRTVDPVHEPDSPNGVPSVVVSPAITEARAPPDVPAPPGVTSYDRPGVADLGGHRPAAGRPTRAGAGRHLSRRALSILGGLMAAGLGVGVVTGWVLRSSDSGRPPAAARPRPAPFESSPASSSVPRTTPVAERPDSASPAATPAAGGNRAGAAPPQGPNELDPRSALPTVEPTTPPAAGPPRPAKPARTGWMVLYTEPWATVTWEGGRLGVTPLRAELPEGTHPIVLVSPGGVRRTVTVTIRPGRETRRVVRLPVDTWR